MLKIAKVSIKLPDEIISKLSNLGDKTDIIIEEMLQTGAEVVYTKIKSNLKAVIGRNTKNKSESTGELLSALGISPVKQDKSGIANIKIGFSEPRKSGISNALVANVLEYGKYNQPPRPFLKPARTASRKECIAAMQAVFEEELEKS